MTQQQTINYKQDWQKVDWDIDADGKWHQITLNYDSGRKELRRYSDGKLCFVIDKPSSQI